MNEIQMIVRADRFGLCHAANQAVCEAFETGILTCASLAIAAPWSAEAIRLMLEHPEWEVGLQLMLTCPSSACRWGPVAGANAVPSLVDPGGLFCAVLPDGAREEDIVHEMQAQANRARALGWAPAFLECEEADHADVGRVLHRLSEELGIPANLRAWGVIPLVWPVDPPPSGAAAAQIAQLQPGTHLWITQPASDSPETWGLWPDEAGERAAHDDAHALCSAEVRSVIAARGIELISARQFLESRLGTEAEGD